jgi:quercetin dioxygenase-like cupin family protein
LTPVAAAASVRICGPKKSLIDRDRPQNRTGEDVMSALLTPRNLLVGLALIRLADSAVAQQAMQSMVVAPEALTWKDNPALPEGVQMAVVYGDPTKAGEVFVTRTKFPPNTQVAAHTHPFAEYVTVISGSIYLGEGDKLDTTRGQLFRAGTFYFNPAKHAHYGWTTNEEAIVQVQGVGPFGIDFIGPAGDPNKK